MSTPNCKNFKFSRSAWYNFYMQEENSLTIRYSGAVTEHDYENHDFRGHVNFTIPEEKGSDKVYQIRFKLGLDNRLVAWNQKGELLCTLSNSQHHDLTDKEFVVGKLLETATGQVLKHAQESYSRRSRESELFSGRDRFEIPSGYMTLEGDGGIAEFKELLPQLQLDFEAPINPRKSV